MARRVCRYFSQSGYCFYGENCQFVHDGTGGQPGTESPGQLSLENAPDGVHLGPAPLGAAVPTSYAAKAAEPQTAIPDVASGLAGLELAADDLSLTEGAAASSSGFADEEYSVNGPSTAGMATTGLGMVGDPRYVTSGQESADGQQDEDDSQAPAMLPHMEGGTTYFYQLEEEEPGIVGSNIPLSVYAGVPPYVASQAIKSREGPRSYFASSQVAEDLTRRQMLIQSVPEAGAEPVKEVDKYQQLYRLEPLDAPGNKQFSARLFHFPTNCYKALSSKDGQHFCLRHILGYSLSSTASMVLIDKWRKLIHPNICTLREVFSTKAFGPTSSLVFIHDYFAGAETMQHRFFNSLESMGEKRMMAGGAGASGMHGSLGNSHHPGSAGLEPGLKEPLIWNFIVQLASAIRAVHNSGLACRVIHPTKIIVTGDSRIRLSSVGVMDILTFDIGHTDQEALMSQCQQEDLTALGRLILCLGCNSLAALQNPHGAIDILSRHYSGDLKNTAVYLLSSQLNRSINNIMPMIGARFFSHIDSMMCQMDVLETELMKELQNGRLFRLLCKYGMINERPEFNMDVQWSETGDRYLLKLFRDYLFHQVSEDGTPWLDLSHIIHCLNMLDAGSPAKICLESRDEMSVIIVSYQDLKRCFETAFNEVSAGPVAPPPMAPGYGPGPIDANSGYG